MEFLSASVASQSIHHSVFSSAKFKQRRHQEHS